MKKIITSLSIIAVVAAVVISGTTAYFSDTEKSTGNTFTAGAIDLKVDSKCTYNGQPSDQCGTWGQPSPTNNNAGIDLTDQKFFYFVDLKPGDTGENTISLHVNNNNAWACAKISVTGDQDMTCTEPELGDDNNCVDNQQTPGEIAENLSLAWWADDGDNIFEEGEHPFFMNGAKLSALLTAGGPENKDLYLTLADKNTNFFEGIDNTGNTTPLTGDQTYYIGMQWCFGDMAIEGNTITCNGQPVNNAPQTDKLTADMEFYVVQSRNNTNFSCADTYRRD